MKKIIIGMVAFALCLGMNSCKKETTPAGDEKESTEQVSKNQGTKEEAPSMSAADILAKAKAEGAKWSVDEWKAAFKDMLLCAKPMFVEIGSLQENIGDDPAKAAKALGQLKKIQEKSLFSKENR